MTALEKKSEEQPIVIKRDELPAYCPTESMGLWNSHPRVYIPLEETGTADCPYCGNRFVLAE